MIDTNLHLYTVTESLNDSIVYEYWDDLNNRLSSITATKDNSSITFNVNSSPVCMRDADEARPKLTNQSEYVFFNDVATVIRHATTNLL